MTLTPDELHAQNLSAALLAITTEAGKVGYLYPAPKRALAAYIAKLEQDNERLQKKLNALHEAYTVDISELHDTYLPRIIELEHDNERLRAELKRYTEKQQPFYMVVQDE